MYNFFNAKLKIATAVHNPTVTGPQHPTTASDHFVEYFCSGFKTAKVYILLFEQIVERARKLS